MPSKSETKILDNPFFIFSLRFLRALPVHLNPSQKASVTNLTGAVKSDPFIAHRPDEISAKEISLRINIWRFSLISKPYTLPLYLISYTLHLIP